MTDRVPRPWHLWAIGVISLLWNAFGGYDYLMQNTRNAAYMAQMPAAAVQHLDELPVWAIGFWTLGVWGAVLGSLLLLIRSRLAVYAFAASLLGLAANTAYTMTSQGSAGEPVGLTIAIWAVAIGLLIYALRMRQAGVLR
jgi:hypothetical protein